MTVRAVTILGIVFLIALSMISIGFYQNLTGNPTERASISYVLHAPIFIDGDSGFLGANASTGISSGSGTHDDPYIIEGWEIDATLSANWDGIRVNNTNSSFIIRQCLIYGAQDTGIEIDWGRDCLIRENVLVDNHGGGIYTYHVRNSIIENNIGYATPPHTVSRTIYISYASTDNIIANNSCSNNTHYGIQMAGAPTQRNTIVNNTCFSNNEDGIYINTDAVGGPSNNSIIGNNCSDNFYGIYSLGSDRNIYSENNCSGNQVGIFLDDSVKNIVSDNLCSGDQNGIELGYYANSNTVTDNNCSGNLYGMMIIQGSTGNEISLNTFHSNAWYGLTIENTAEASTANRISDNSFTYNNGSTGAYSAIHIQAYDGETGNWWDSVDGYGNWWSDWTSPDVEKPIGIVDLPYNISGAAGSKDFFPLTVSHVIPDLIPPTTNASISGESGLNGWYISEISATLTAIDSDSGVNCTKYRVDDGGGINYSASIDISGEGVHILRFYSLDNNGNSEGTNIVTVRIDTENPLTHSDITNSTVTLSAGDNTSGVAMTYFRVDNDIWHNYTGPISVDSEGNHSIDFYSVDMAGNNESFKTVWVDNGTGGGGVDPFNLILILIIIGILVAIAIPAIFGMRRKAKESDAKASNKDIGTTWAQLMDDVKKEPPKEQKK